MTKTFTALDQLADRAVTAGKAESAIRAKAKTRDEFCFHHHASYKNGEAVAYIEARKIVEAELRRLCNRFQNGCLDISDFGINL